jgi:hypothetical protein
VKYAFPGSGESTGLPRFGKTDSLWDGRAGLPAEPSYQDSLSKFFALQGSAMAEVLKALLGSSVGRIFLAAILVISTALIVAVLGLLWRVLGKGAKLDFWGLTISSTTAATSQEARSPSVPSSSLPSEKIVYVKLLHMRERDGVQKPVYRHQFWDGQELDVWDEALYLFYQSFPEEQQSFRWNIRSSGVAHPNLMHHWKDKIEFPDPGEPTRSRRCAHLLRTFPRLHSCFLPFQRPAIGQQGNPFARGI